MNKNVTGICLAAVFLVAVFSTACLAGSPEMEAIAVFKGDVVKALPLERKLTRVAVLDFKGDEYHMVGNAVISAINEKTPWKVMERVDFAKILEEQGLQLKDIMDEKTRIRHGRLKGVQGLVMGNVYSVKDGFMSSTIKANVRLVDVEKGEVILARDFEASAVSPFRPYVLAGSGALVIFLALTLFFSRRARRRRSVWRAMGIEKAVDHRNGMAQGIDKIMMNVAEAKSKLVETGKTSDAVDLKNIERDLMHMKRSLAGGGSWAGTDRESVARDTGSLDQQVLWKLEDLEELSRRIRSMVSSPERDEVWKEINALKAGVGRVEGDLRDRSPRFL